MIELVMVIVIIGILSAAAIPRFSNLSDSAQIAANQQFAGALRSAVNTVHIAWIAAGASGATTVTLEGTGFSTNSLGWPDASMGFSAGNNCKNVPASTGGTGILVKNIFVINGVCANCYRASGSGSLCTFAQQDASSNPTGYGVRYNLSTGLVTVY